ncbi:metal transporter [Mangrovimicrobium sediminis]|uniref:Metal transporter n=2 Tax=Mangrovimicrobium sediminis TaxID=2562682 RepID=A0A4Z0M8M8_9GAMM|nr:metal transporter [Haliea sp. SAOS-164]
MIRCMLRSEDGGYQLGQEELLGMWRANGGQVWLDIEHGPDQHVHELLESMGCDPLAIQDSFRTRHPPKVEEFDDTTFVLFRGISTLDENLDLEPQQVGIWVGRDFLITLHRGPSVSVGNFWEKESDAGLLAAPNELALHLLHYASGRYLDRLLEFEERLGDLEDGLSGDRSEEEMKALVLFRTRLRRLRRIFSYHKDLAEYIWDPGTEFLGRGEDDSFHLRRDVHDRCERLFSLCSMYYEICGDLIEGHISLSSHKLNQTMKVLTIISAIFVPLTFLAGIYGMNFEYIPELSWRYAYFTLLGVMAVMGTGMLVLFRRIRWL